MTWDNNHGITVKPTEVKVFSPSHTWAMKLSQLARQGYMRIITYNISDVKYVLDVVLAKRPNNIQLIVHERFWSDAETIKRKYPEIRVALNDAVHSKVVVIEPKTLYIGSTNFGSSGWHEMVVGVRSQEAHDWFVKNEFEPLWSRSRELQPTTHHHKAA